jgi:hypothetical protein
LEPRTVLKTNITIISSFLRPLKISRAPTGLLKFHHTKLFGGSSPKFHCRMELQFLPSFNFFLRLLYYFILISFKKMCSNSILFIFVCQLKFIEQSIKLHSHLFTNIVNTFLSLKTTFGMKNISILYIYIYIYLLLFI